MRHKDVTVLLVDDDDVDVMGVRRAFEKAKIGNTIIVARDGLDALEKLRAQTVNRPYLILLDLNMPRMNGMEFLDEIRKDGTLKDSVIFVLTTSTAEQDIWQAYQRNIAGYIVKENVGEEFLSAISLLDMYWRIVEFPEGKGM